MQKMMEIMGGLMPVEILPQERVLKMDVRYIGTDYQTDCHTDIYEEKATGELIGYENRKG